MFLFCTMREWLRIVDNQEIQCSGEYPIRLCPSKQARRLKTAAAHEARLAASSGTKAPDAGSADPGSVWDAAFDAVARR
jgi:hypothetical protein